MIKGSKGINLHVYCRTEMLTDAISHTSSKPRIVTIIVDSTEWSGWIQTMCLKH